MISNASQIFCLNIWKAIKKWTLRELSLYPALRTSEISSCNSPPEPPPCAHDICYVGPLTKQPKIIIVGAGVAGLSAAQRLVQCGLNDIVILEANDRIGGRVFTCDFHGTNIELGAQWIYGGSIGNPIYNLASQECLLHHPLDRLDPYRGIFFTSDGVPIDTHIYNRAKSIFSKILEMIENKETKSYSSLWHFIMSKINEEMSNLTPYEQNYSRRVLLGLTNDLKVKFAADLSDVSVDKLRYYNRIPGGDVTIPKGFKSIFNPILKKLPKDCLKLNKIVNKIRWHTGGDPRVEIYTADGSTFAGDYVIATVSLGVLKKCHQNLFIPDLTPKKLAAIEKLGFGHVNKVFLHYDKPFWLTNEAYLRPSWTDKEINDRYKWMHSIGIIEEAPATRNVLTFTIGGVEAMYLEKCSEKVVMKIITKLIRRFAADSSLPCPTSIVKSKWSYDPLYYGAVTYLTNDSFPKHMNDLAAPLPEVCVNAAPSLYMAGEATAIGDQGTVHGARLSGIREADRIITLTKRFRGPPPIEPPTRICSS